MTDIILNRDSNSDLIWDDDSESYITPSNPIVKELQANDVVYDIVAKDLDVGDYVVEWQLPTSENNYTWYRLYKSGWVEQGGRTTSNYGSNGTQVQLLKSMNNTDYHLQVTQYTDRRDGMGSTVIPSGYIVDSSTIYVAGRYVSNAEDAKLCWEVKGMAAQS